MNDIIKNLIKQFMPFAQKHIGFEDPPKLFLKQDQENASNPLGKTAFYDPAAKSITLYITARHPKDILRSLGHELVHHKQNCCGEFEDAGDMGPGYAQDNPFLRTKEEEANRDGSMCLRDFEDMLKKENTIYYEHLSKGENKMSIKDWKNKEVSQLLSEAWGFKFNSLQEFEEFGGTGELQAEGEEELEEFADRGGRGKRAKPQGTGTRVEPDAPFQKPPTEEDEEDEDEPLEEAEDDKDDTDDVVVEQGSFTTNMPKDIPTTAQVMKKMSDEKAAKKDKEEENKKKDESVDHLKEAIASLLRKKLKG
tara:strand:+ start:1402 stop:2325 length:924 start_codon:yes stop_codon:yes gene_type:complete